ncbi:STAS domain-containing protein [Actinacidiphila bryophytorum]|uniref:STAS domain-containing protein n=1 Tax=Actinacidiphila bryophytorum TaxID=1436133 RepID=A0A9W4H6N6_9ACTN|nr:STAS domain-containing protein [Actinacidiphila bryophytorum]MBM9436831.1 STAS domain-containing protein [Actinacidiphila bryophytorum]MBN6542326.1 STAS domain-containing protein [Actinacidiphila bryophytorum]CAG7654490.1 STAS domain-containing protein [Actinacidiphila bryophytorum]
MTTSPSPYLRLTTVDAATTVRIEVNGDLDYDSAPHLLAVVTGKLAERPDLKDLHLHCAGLGAIDSIGLSALLMIHRHTSTAGVRLHLEHRTARLERLLAITGTLDHLTTVTTGDANAPADTAQAKPRTNATPARLTGPDSTA